MNVRTIFTAALLALTGMTAMAESYKDPRQRFELEVPAGWSAEAFGEGVKIARGGAYFLVMDGAGDSPDATVSRIVSQFGSQWSKFLLVKQGSAVVDGQPAPFSFNFGVNPKGVPSFLKVTVVFTRGRSFALVGSAPQAEFADLKPGFDQLEQTFHFRVSRPPAPPESRRHLEEPGPQAVSAAQSGGMIRRRVVRGGKESAAQIKALGRIFRKL